jgi:methyl-accepting chemotaxis protein
MQTAILEAHKPTESPMRLNPFKNVRLSTQLFALVAVSLLVASGLIAYAMHAVRSTQGTLKHTVDNRMVSGQSIQGVADAMSLALDSSEEVAQKKVDAATARDQIKTAVDKAQEDWDRYFLSEMIPQEQELADQTTPLLDKAYVAINRLQTKLQSGDTADLSKWRNEELRPALAAATTNLKSLIDMQLTAANMDLKEAGLNYQTTLRNSIIMLSVGGLIALVLAWLIIRGAMRSLGTDPSEAARIAKRIAAGDLEFEVPTRRHDETSLLGALRQMKDSLLQSKLDYEGQINAISKVQGVVECTPSGDIIGANEIFLKLLGYTLEEVKGQHYSMFVDNEVRASRSYQGFWPALQRGESRQGDYRKRAKNGTDIWVQGIYNPIIGADGKPFKVVAYLLDVTQQRQEAQMNEAFKGALNKLSANVMVADNDGLIIYLNDASETMLKAAESDIRKDLPSFEVGKLRGANMDVFHRNPTHQRNLLAKLTATHTNQIEIGPRTFRLVANPMYDAAGERLGTVLEWFDRTQEVATEIEVQSIVEAVTAGELERRISLSGKTGFFESLSRGINDLVDSIDTVVREVQQLVTSANNGDLTKRIDTQTRSGLLVTIGSGINALTEGMAGVVSQVKAASAEVSRGADEISQGSANLSQRTEEQASSLEETASSMEEMTSTVKQNAENASQASQLAIAARDQAEKGGSVVSKAVKAMGEIDDASRKISDIIGVIDEIAFQTNLLALNAAVEAARAGEQGRGFAVVATEVRNLAGRSATAAKEIKALIQDSVNKVKEGSTLVTQSGATLDQIVNSVKKVTDIVAEIAAASNEQSAGIGQVNKAIVQLDELTQQNAALVEEASAASQAMAEQARELNEAMQRYHVDAGVQSVMKAPAAKAPTAKAPAAKAAAPRPTAASLPGSERRNPGRPWSPPTDAQASDAGEPNIADDPVWKVF